MTARVIQGSVFDVLPTLEPGSIDACVTSPPYWRLRSYLPADHPLKPLELGSEPSPAAYVENMVRVFELVKVALADHAVCWLNVGDTYSSDWPCQRRNVIGNGSLEDGTRKNRPSRSAGLPDGNLCLIPQRLAIALQAAGWLVRSVVVWHKPAPMPTSVSGWQWRRCRVKVKGGTRADRGTKQNAHPNRTVAGLNERWREGAGNGNPQQNHDGKAFLASAQWKDCPGCPKCSPHGGYVLRRGSWRPTSSWEPVLMLAKSAKYFADGDAVKQPGAAATLSRNEYTRVIDDPDEQFAVRHDHETTVTTANLRDCWTIPAEPLREKHYAAFPTELVHRCLKSSTSARGYCPACGGPWVRVVETTSIGGEKRQRDVGGRTDGFTTPNGAFAESRTVGWRPSCRCPGDLDPRPGVVLDPFAGSARVGIEALRLGLDFVGCELNESYCEMARRLLREESPLFSGA